MELLIGFEPTTTGLQNRDSTNWVTVAWEQDEDSNLIISTHAPLRGATSVFANRAIAGLPATIASCYKVRSPVVRWPSNFRFISAFWIIIGFEAIFYLYLSPRKGWLYWETDTSGRFDHAARTMKRRWGPPTWKAGGMKWKRRRKEMSSRRKGIAFLTAYGSLSWNRTSTPFGTRLTVWRDYLFRHQRVWQELKDSNLNQ